MNLKFSIDIFVSILSFYVCFGHEKCKFTSKKIQVPYSSRITFDIEFIDICYMSTNKSFIAKSIYTDIDTSYTMDQYTITYLKNVLTKFDINVGKVLGKGNYGLVFAADSKMYGKVAIKVASNTDGVFFDMRRKHECYAPRAHGGIKCQASLDKTIPFEIAGAVITRNIEGVVKSKAYGIITLNRRIVFYFIIMENIQNSMTRKLICKLLFKILLRAFKFLISFEHSTFFRQRLSQTISFKSKT